MNNNEEIFENTKNPDQNDRDFIERYVNPCTDLNRMEDSLLLDIASNILSCP